MYRFINEHKKSKSQQNNKAFEKGHIPMKKLLFSAVILGAVLLTSCGSNGFDGVSNYTENGSDIYDENSESGGKTEEFAGGFSDENDTGPVEKASKTDDKEKKYPDGSLTYSNLTGESARNEVKELLSVAGVPENRIEKILEWVNDYNKCMGSCENFELKEDFTSVSAYAVDYGDYYPMSALWYKTNKRNYADILCRLAAFELLSDFISVSAPLDKSEWECYSDTQWLYSDYDAICNNPLVDFGEGEKEKYFSLYSPVQIKTGCSEQEMYDKIIKEWEKRGIAFEKGKCSLITIWLQSEGLTAAGHAAVLAENEDGLLLFEKTNPQSPYQATKFSDLEQVKMYMFESLNLDNARYGLETGTYIVMKNDKMI